MNNKECVEKISEMFSNDNSTSNTDLDYVLGCCAELLDAY